MPEEPNQQSERRLSAIMFSDIVGYSKMMQEDEDLTLELLSRHNVIVRNAIKKHDGKEIKVIGDAFLVDFTTVANAVRCAIEIQEAFSRYNADKPQKEKILLRIGIHVGDIVVKENDVFGDGVNIAARIQPVAVPGGICISQEVFNMVKHKLDVDVVSLGPKELKNIKDKIEIYEILVGSISGKELAASGRRIVTRAKPMHKRLGTRIVAGIALIAIVVGVYLLEFRKPEPASQMVSRTLKVPSLNANYPNISPDGNWVVYVADDGKGFQNLYVINASGGEPKKITNDTLSNYGSPCFSPDATEIIYDQLDSATYSRNIYRVSMLGGTPRKIISNGELPIWSPDGKHIGFFRGIDYIFIDYLFIVNADGTEEKEIAKIESPPSDLVATDLAWSPDSKEIAFLRSFESPTTGAYSEIFIRNLATGTERQLTDDKKVIGDICWTTTNEIIYDSDRGGYTNLWTIPATGGTPKQLTLGVGKDLVPRISKDGKRMVYGNMADACNLWTVNLETEEMKQITFEDGSLSGPQYAPDGKRILYYRSDNSGLRSQLFVSNPDGSEPIRVANEHQQIYNTRWSGDGKSIAYSIVRKDTVSAKSDFIARLSKALTYTINRKDTVSAKSDFVDGPRIIVKNLLDNTTNEIGGGALINWSPDGKYLLYRRYEPFQYILALTASVGKPLRQIVSRSIPSFSHDSKNVIYTDSVYLWTLSVDNGKVNRLRKLPRGFTDIRETSDGKSIFGRMLDEKRKKWLFAKISKTGPQVEELFEVEGRLYGSSISPDMKTVVLSRGEERNKIMLIDNFR